MTQTRKDLLQAHRLMSKRAALALLQAEPDPSDQPLRRLSISGFFSLLVAAIAAVVFAIWGFIAPGHAGDLTASGSLLIDKATGTPFVPCLHGKLCPVINYASARLALDTANPDQRQVTQGSLARYPRGPEIGIPGLPPLPAPGMLVGQPWSVCVQTEVNQAILTRHTVTTLVAGQQVGGRPMSSSQVLVVAAGGKDWVIWNGERMRVPGAQQAGVLTTLGIVQAPIAVPLPWLNAFSQGPNFAPMTVDGFGSTVRDGPGRGPARIGQVFTTGPGTRQLFYVLTRRGLVPVSATEARLLGAEHGAVKPGTVTPAEAASHVGHLQTGGMPVSMPSPVNKSISHTAPLCVEYSSQTPAGPMTVQVTAGGRVPTGVLPITGNTEVNQIAMKPGAAALVAEVPDVPTSSSGASRSQRPAVTGYFLVTGGVRYGLASPGTAAILGYDLNKQKTLVPTNVLGLIPQGPALDPSIAKNQVPG